MAGMRKSVVNLHTRPNGTIKFKFKCQLVFLQGLSDLFVLDRGDGVELLPKSFLFFIVARIMNGFTVANNCKLNYILKTFMAPE